LLKEWRGIHIFSRLLPKNWFKCQILAWLEMRKHPAWLEHWSGFRIENALWDGEKAIIEVTRIGDIPGKLIIGLRKKIVKITLNGKVLPVPPALAGKMELHPGESGQLKLLFEEEKVVAATI